MFLILLGIIVFIISFSVKKMNTQFSPFSNVIRLLGLLIIVIGFLTSCIKQIDAGQVGVQQLFGKVENDVLPSGLHIVSPLLDIKSVDIKTQNYTMSGVHDEGNKLQFWANVI